MTTKNWTGSSSTDWQTPGNWNPSGAPGSTDDVQILTTSISPLLNGAVVAVNSITLGTDTLALNNAGIDVANGVSLTSTGGILAEAGVELNGAITANAGSNATIEAGLNTFEVTGKVTDNSGALTLLIADSSVKLVLDAASTAHTLNFSGTTGELDLKSTLGLGTALTIGTGTVSLLDAAAALTDGAGLSLQSGGKIQGQGKVTGGVTGPGTVTANGGTLELANALPASTSTAFVIDAASVLLLDQTPGAGNTYTFQGATGGFALADDIGFSGRIAGMNVGNNSALTTYIDIKGYTVNVASESGQGTTNGRVALSDGTVLTLSGITSSQWLAKTSSDGNGGTDIYLLSAAPPPAGGVSDFPQSEWQLIGTGDLNGDGFSDLVWFDSSIDTVEQQFTRDLSTIGGGPIPNNPFVNGWNVLGIGDFNGDGNSDLVWRLQGTSLTEIELLHGGFIVGGGAIVGNPFDASWNVVGVGDFNGDGDSDLVWQQPALGVTEIQFLNGATAIGGGAIVGNPFGSDWKVVGVGDFNGDGKSDLVWQQQGTGFTELEFLSGLRIVGGGAIAGNPFGAGWNVVGTGDFNGDGKSDLVWQQQGTGLTEFEFLNGTNIVGGGAIFNNPFGVGWNVAGVGDFNGDGKPDLVYQNSSVGLTEVLLLNGLIPIGGGLLTLNS